MSSIVWDGANLIQRAAGKTEELGHVKLDPGTNEYVLWLRDHRDVFVGGKGYVRGDSFASLSDAVRKAARSTSAGLFHLMWLIGIRDDEATNATQLARSISKAESGQPLTESTFKEEMEKSERRELRNLIIGAAIGVAGLLIGLAGLWA